MHVISLKMEKKLLDEIDSTLKNHRYSTRTEFIRDAIRMRLSDLEKEQAIKRIAELRGSLKGKALMDEETARKLAVEKIAKKLGVGLE